MMVIIFVARILYTLLISVLPIYIYRHKVHKDPIEPLKAKTIVFIDAVIVFTVDILVQTIISSNNPGSKINPASLIALAFWGGANYRILTKGYAEKADFSHINKDKNLKGSL